MQFFFLHSERIPVHPSVPNSYTSPFLYFIRWVKHGQTIKGLVSVVLPLKSAGQLQKSFFLTHRGPQQLDIC